MNAAPFQSRNVLIVDDDIDLAESLKELLEDIDYKVTVASSIPDAESAIMAFDAQVALLDIRLGRENGVELIDVLKSHKPSLLCVMITGYAAVDTAISALRKGAYDYLNKPLHPEVLISTLDRCYEHLQVKEERNQVTSLLADEREKAFITLECTGDGVITCDNNGTIEYLNPKAESLSGWKLEEIKGKPIADYFKFIYEFGRDKISDPVTRCLQTHRISKLPNYCSLITKTKDALPIGGSVAPLKKSEGDVCGVVMVLRDSTDSRKMESQIDYQANHDLLTGLLNRYALETKLHELLSLSKSTQTSSYFGIIDLDMFKVINDSSGHAAGDALLRQTSQLLSRTITSEDYLSRIGSDEFAVILSNRSEKESAAVMQKALDDLNNSGFAWMEKKFNLSASAGLVPVNGNMENISQIFQLADTACNLAKESGGNKVHLYSSDDIKVMHRQAELEWASKLLNIIEKDDILIYFQGIHPIQQSDDRQLYLEILIRLEDENKKLIPPGEFIPPAERFNLMKKIDRWVIHNTFKWLNEHPDVLDRMAHCGINLSGQTIGEASLTEFILHELNHFSIPPQKICFEITETATIDNLGNAVKLMKDVKNLGAKFALDDFGSGLSSFAYLAQLPVDFLKIDGLFVKDVTNNSVHKTMIKAITEIAHAMNMETIAEYVENDEIIAALKEIGVDFAQGFGLSKPTSIENL